MAQQHITRDAILNKIYSMIEQVWLSFDASDRNASASMQGELFMQPEGKPIIAPTGALSLVEHYDAHQHWEQEQHQVLSADLEILNISPLVVQYTGVHGWQAVSKAGSMAAQQTEDQGAVSINQHVHQSWVLQSDDGSVDNLKWVSFVTPYITNAHPDVSQNNLSDFSAE